MFVTKKKDAEVGPFLKPQFSKFQFFIHFHFVRSSLRLQDFRRWEDERWQPLPRHRVGRRHRRHGIVFLFSTPQNDQDHAKVPESHSPIYVLRQERWKGKFTCHFGIIQCDQIWRNFATLASAYKSLGIFLTVYSSFGKMLNPLWQICDSIVRIFIVTNGHILKNNLTIRSHLYHRWTKIIPQDCSLSLRSNIERYKMWYASAKLNKEW